MSGGDINKKDEEEKKEKTVMLIAGDTNWDLINRKHKPEPGTQFMGPVQFKLPFDEEVKKVCSSCNSCHQVLITESGSAYVFGRNEKGQLGTGDFGQRFVPLEVELPAGIRVVDAATGRNHTLLLSDTGRVWGMGDNKQGQLGIDKLIEITIPTEIKSLQKHSIKKLACGAEFSMAITDEGKLLSFGTPQYGVLGHGSDEATMVTGNKLVHTPQPDPEFVGKFKDKKIKTVVCGERHVMVLDEAGILYTWGSGDYGRLGHNVQEDEFKPKELQFFSNSALMNCELIAAGSHCSLAYTKAGQFYLWGKWKTTGSGGSGEPWMYPRSVYDLAGWEKILQLHAGNCSILAMAGNSVASWGQNCVGELGHGENEPKSATKPKIAEPFQGATMYSVCCGSATTFFLLKEDEETLKLPIYEPEDCALPPTEDGKRKASVPKGRPLKKGKATA